MKGKLYWVNGQPPEEGKYAVIADSSFIKLLDEALKDFPEPTGMFGGGHDFQPSDICTWLIKWFGKIPDHVESQLNQAFVEYLKAHLRDGGK